MAPAADPMLVVVQRADDKVVTDAVRRLKPVDREIVMLDVWEGLSRAEIADVMGMTRAAVDQRIHRAYQKLSRALVPVLEISSLNSPPIAEEGVNMTHDQIREMVRRVNPIPDPSTLEIVDVPVLTTPLERRTEMQIDDRPGTEVQADRNRRRGPLVGIAAAAVILIAGLVFLLTKDNTPGGRAGPECDPDQPRRDGFGLAPGAYFVDTDGDEASSLGGTFVIEDSGWSSHASGGEKGIWRGLCLAPGRPGRRGVVAGVWRW